MLEWNALHLPDGFQLRLIASPAGIRAIDFDFSRPFDGTYNESNSLLGEAARQLRSYFEGKLRDFKLDLDIQGTQFQRSVWMELLTIPYGATRSYSEIACAIGAPKAVRAVGAANGANPIPIVVPCHRVIGSSGKLVGYGGGLPLKKKLLELEGAASLSLY